MLKSSFSLLNADQVQLNHKWNFRNVTSTFYRLYLVSDGHGKIYNDQIIQDLEPGYLYLIPSFTPCNYICEQTLGQYYLAFTEESADGSSLFDHNRKLMKIKASDADFLHFKRLLQINPNRGLHQTHDPEIYEKRPVLRTYQGLNNESSLAAFTETTGIILQLLARFLNNENFKTGIGHAIPSKIHDAINFIQINLTSVLTVQQLAGRANQNTDYFSRLFATSTGERPLKFIQSKRLERAQTLLGTTNLPYHEIAIASGFNNAAYFSRIFKQTMGKTPGEFKKSCALRECI